MATITAPIELLDCFQPERVKLQRVNYFPRQLLTAEDMITDQDYFRQKLRRHNRFLHGWGVVCGLAVTAAPTDEEPWLVKIGSGYALGPYGDEIYVAESHTLDLSRCGPDAATSPCEPDVLRNPGAVAGNQVYVAIKYAECMASPVRAMPAGCGCDESACEYSRIRDSFEICCLPEPPPSPPPPSICELIESGGIAPCPPCPDDPWVVLAVVNLPASTGTEVANNMINNLVRRQLYSTAMLQQQLIDCCCGGREVPQADLRINAAGLITGPRTITYGIVVRNLGPSPAQGVVVKSTISGPTIVQVLGFDPPQVWTQDSPLGPFHAEIGDLSVQDTFELKFSAIVDAGSYVNTLTVSSQTEDPNPGNNTDTATTVFNPQAEPAR